MIRIIIGLLVFAAAMYFAVQLWSIHWLLTVAVAGIGGWLAAKIAF
jgi:hypothetical protein